MKINLKLGNKVVLLILFIVLISVSSGAAISYKAYKRSTINTSQQLLLTASRFKEQAVSIYLEIATEETKLLLLDGVHAPNLISYVSGDLDIEEKVRQDLDLHLLRESEFFDRGSVINLEGKVLISTDPSEEGKYKNDKRYFLDLITDEDTDSYHQILYDFSSDETNLVFAQKIKGEGGDLLGILKTNLDLEVISELMTLRAGLGKTGETYVINKNNFVVTELRKIPESGIGRTMFSPEIEDCFDGESKFVVVNDYVNDSVLRYTNWSDQLNSCIITDIDMAEVLGPVNAAVISIFSISLLIFIILGLIGYKSSRLITEPITKLRDVALRIKEGDYSVRASVKTGDEIGELAEVFNDMAENIETTYSRLEEVVRSKTKELRKALKRERRYRKEQVRQRERLRSILSSMGEGLLVIDKDYKVIEANETTEELLGLEKEQMMGRKWNEVVSAYVSGQQIDFSERSFAKAINEGKRTVTSLEDDHYYEPKEGNRFPIVSVTAPLIQDGQIAGAVKAFRDATVEKEYQVAIEKEVKKRTQEYREERAKLTASINSLGLGFVLADKDSNVLHLNKTVLNILEIDKGEISIEGIAQRLGDEIDLSKHIQTCLAEKKSCGESEVDYEGKILSIHVFPVLIGESEPDVIGFVLLVEDVTENKTMERSKDEFFAVASHELRTPLTAIRGNTSLIMQHYMDKLQDQDLKEMISDMHQSSVRLIEIVNDFLDASKLEQGKMDIELSNFDIVPEIHKDVDELKEYKKSNDMDLRFEASDSKVIVNADKDRVHQIVTNLTGNALKFTKEGEVVVSIEEMEDIVKVRVSDTGMGIDEKHKDLLFKKFQQVGGKVRTRDVSKGTGMGLYISRLLVEKMGGRIYLEKSEPGEGSVFSFELQKGKLD